MYINRGLDLYLYTKLKVIERNNVTVKGNKNSKKKNHESRGSRACTCSRAMPKQADYQTLRTPRKGTAIKKNILSFKEFKAHKRTLSS
ncbi:unnamed protein product [Rhizophagus irregularis]|nr:unnamed protein product [Rhizophagus irregularis]